MKLRSFLIAATPVVPDPQKGSRMVPPLGQKILVR